MTTQTVKTSLTQVRALLARQQALSQQQNKRIARRIHDDISQKMTLLALQISLASSDDNPPEDWANTCKDWADLVMELGQTVREITNELQPRIIDDFGLASALRWFAQCSPKDICCCCTFVEPQDAVAVERFTANELFGICRDIIAELFVPAGVARVQIMLDETDGEVHLRLRANDDALGQERIAEESFGAISIQDRLDCIEGAVELNYSAQTGSVVTLSVPARRSAPLCAAR